MTGCSRSTGHVEETPCARPALTVSMFPVGAEARVEPARLICLENALVNPEAVRLQSSGVSQRDRQCRY